MTNRNVNLRYENKTFFEIVESLSLWQQNKSAEKRNWKRKKSFSQNRDYLESC